MSTPSNSVNAVFWPPNEFTSGGFVNAVGTQVTSVMPYPQSYPVYIPTPAPTPVEHTYGCEFCRKIRQKPATTPKAGYHGFCGTCGRALTQLICGSPDPTLVYCQEPIHPGERFCSACGHDNTLMLLHWDLISDEKVLQELGARGNAEEEGSPFRGVRET